MPVGTGRDGQSLGSAKAGIDRLALRIRAAVPAPVGTWNTALVQHAWRLSTTDQVQVEAAAESWVGIAGVARKARLILGD